jgi:hypothetical protein
MLSHHDILMVRACLPLRTLVGLLISKVPPALIYQPAPRVAVQKALPRLPAAPQVAGRSAQQYSAAAPVTPQIEQTEVRPAEMMAHQSSVQRNRLGFVPPPDIRQHRESQPPTPEKC